MGFVHHSNYLKYFEAARLEWLDKLGISYKKMEEDGVLLPVIYTEIKYLFPLKFDDIFVVKVGIDKIPLSRLILNYQINSHENSLNDEAKELLELIKGLNPKQLEQIKMAMERPKVLEALETLNQLYAA